jgi:hypothetical protein
LFRPDRRGNSRGEWMKFDVVTVTDLRFPGGSSGSTLEEINIQHAAGLRTGLYHLPSTTLMRRRNFHPGITRAILAGKAVLLNPEAGDVSGPIETDLLIYRHPSVINHHDGPLPRIAARSVLLVVNHPPINSKGRIDYLLPYARTRLAEVYGVPVAVMPIGPVVRTAVARYYGAADVLSPTDWNNVFDLTRFRARTDPAPHDPIRIGRHSRPNREKWPEDPADILGAYPDRPDIAVHVLGGTAIPEGHLGYRPANWVVHEFGTRAVEAFLHEIDVFVYFHHPRWVEAFGRVIAEGMATGAPTILPPHFEPLFGDGALYTQPAGVADIVERLRDPAYFAERSHAAASYVRRHFDAELHLRRLEGFGVVGARRAA